MTSTLPYAGGGSLRSTRTRVSVGVPASRQELAARVDVPDGLEAAERSFSARFPGFDPGGSFAALRQREYGRLDANDQVYLDYTGGGLHAACQIAAHVEFLESQVLGNPHSNNPTSLAATALVERCRRAVCEFFNAPPEEYLCVFTANATGALRLVGESYRFEPGGVFALPVDNHNSVNGIREFAGRRGAAIAYVPVIAPELRLDRTAMTNVLAAADRSKANLLAFPAQSNFSGVQHPLDLVEEAHAFGWDVLVDASSFAPTNSFDVERTRPDFVAISFYKIIGYPTGIGCLLMRRDRVPSLTRPWFSGGTVTIASVQGEGHYLRPDEGAFEDGTVDYLNLPAVAHGLRHIKGIGLASIHHRVGCLTEWLLEAMNGLRHRDGRRVTEIHGPTDMTDRGGTVTFLVRDREGRVVSESRVEELANRANISLRTGCFCNPGAGEVAHHLGADEITTWFGRDEPVWPLDVREEMLRDHDRVLAAVRVSVGVATNFADVYRLMCFLQGFVDRSVDEIAAELMPSPTRANPPVTVDGTVLRAGAVNEHQARVAAGVTMALGAIAFVYANFHKLFWPIRTVSAFFFVDFLIRVTAGIERSPSGLVAGWMTRRQAPQWVSAKPKRFAWTLGLVMALAMTVITNSGVHGPLPRTICLICLTLMWMEAVLGLCLGCEIYGLMVRRGWRTPDDAFEVCPNGACRLDGPARQRRTA